MSNSEAYSLSCYWSEGINQSKSQQKILLNKTFRSNLLEAFQVTLKALLGLTIPIQYCQGVL